MIYVSDYQIIFILNTSALIPRSLIQNFVVGMTKSSVWVYWWSTLIHFPAGLSWTDLINMCAESFPPPSTIIIFFLVFIQFMMYLYHIHWYLTKDLFKLQLMARKRSFAGKVHRITTYDILFVMIWDTTRSTVMLIRPLQRILNIPHFLVP